MVHLSIAIPIMSVCVCGGGGGERGGHSLSKVIKST